MLTGSAGDKKLAGLTRNDTFQATLGNDILSGDGGSDTADYSALGEPVTLAAFGQLKKDAFGEDKLVSIETIIASSGTGTPLTSAALAVLRPEPTPI